MMRPHIAASAAFIAVAIALAAAAAEKPAFEAATVKPAADNAIQNRMLTPSPNRISIPSMTLTWLIYTAYGEGLNTAAKVKGGPGWMNQTAWAIEGVAHEPATQRQFQAMLRTLLEDRFGLKVHTETVNIDVYALVRDRSDGKFGPKLQAWDGACADGRAPSADDDPALPRCFSGYRTSGIVLDGATMFSAAELLSLPQSRNLLGAIVQDRTGLTGRYKMELDYQFTAPPELAGPSLFTAIREQWGLKLEKAQGPLKVIVVDDAQRPTPN